MTKKEEDEALALQIQMEKEKKAKQERLDEQNSLQRLYHLQAVKRELETYILLGRVVIAILWGVANHIFFKTDVSLSSDVHYPQKIFSVWGFLIMNLAMLMFGKSRVNILEASIKRIIDYQSGVN